MILIPPGHGATRRPPRAACVMTLRSNFTTAMTLVTQTQAFKKIVAGKEGLVIQFLTNSYGSRRGKGTGLALAQDRTPCRGKRKNPSRPLCHPALSSTTPSERHCIQQACPKPALRTRLVLVHQSRTPETEDKGMEGGKGGGGEVGRGDVRAMSWQ